MRSMFTPLMTNKTMSLALAALSLGALAACDGQFSTRGEPTRPPAPQPAPAPAPSPTPSPSPSPAPSCVEGSFQCLDDGTLSWCESGRTVVDDCRGICQDAGFDLATGCDYDVSLGGDSCFCDYAMCDDTDTPTCSASGHGVGYCDDGLWLERDCASVCRDAGLSVSLGCSFDSVVGVDSCFCDAPLPPPPPPSCIEGATECIASDLIVSCEYGREVTLSCDAVCVQAGFDVSVGCGFDGAVAMDSCFCAYSEPVCPYGTEACGDGTCVESAYVCDGYGDCANGGDEFGCTYSCIEGEAVCADGFTIEVCEYQQWAAYDCDDVCWAAGFDMSVGCGWESATRMDGCWCDDF